MTQPKDNLSTDAARRIAEAVRHECRAALFSTPGWRIPRPDAEALSAHIERLDLSPILAKEGKLERSAFSQINPTCDWDAVLGQIERTIEEAGLAHSPSHVRVLIRPEYLHGTSVRRIEFGVSTTASVYSAVVALEYAEQLGRANLLIANIMSVVGAYRWHGTNHGERMP